MLGALGFEILLHQMGTPCGLAHTRRPFEQEHAIGIQFLPELSHRDLHKDRTSRLASLSSSWSFSFTPRFRLRLALLRLQLLLQQRPWQIDLT